MYKMQSSDFLITISSYVSEPFEKFMELKVLIMYLEKSQVL